VQVLNSADKDTLMDPLDTPPLCSRSCTPDPRSAGSTVSKKQFGKYLQRSIMLVPAHVPFGRASLLVATRFWYIVHSASTFM